MAERAPIILNVDDYGPARYARTHVLRRAGFEVLEATTGEDALRVIASTQPDLVLLDINLPDMDGIEVCRRLREQMRMLILPIVHISSTFVHERAEALALEGGSDGYLTEPVEAPVLLATVHSLLRLRHAEEGLRAAGRRWQATFNAIGHGICLLTPEGFVTQCNAAFARLTDKAPEDLVGVSWSTLWCSTPPEGEVAALERVATSRRREEADLERDDRWYRLIAEPMLEGDRIGGVVCILADITSERQAAEARATLLAQEQTAREEAEAANRAKDEFLAMLGHELRNPLDAIASAIHVLDAIGGRDETGLRTRQVINRQVRQLARLVDDLLDVSRMTAGKITLVRKPVDLADIARRSVSMLADAGQPARQHMQLDLQPTWVSGDPARLEQIVMNLLSNAIKYTPADGAIRVAVEGDGRHARLRVEDTGAGLGPEVVERVFDLFFQGARTIDRREGGLGVGLTLVRRLVELHGGRIRASSGGVGRGSTFEVELPQTAPAEAAADGRAALPSVRRRILIVEDNQDSRDMLRYVLELAGHEVHEVSDGPSGLEAVGRLHPDVMLVDIGLPGFDGFELARRVRAMEGVGPRLVALSGYGLPEDRRRSREAGFDAHLVKPVDPDQLETSLLGG